MVTSSVSVVIPTFNRATLVGRAIDSALAQTHPCEVVVCDHGSTDDTPAVASAYGDRIRYIRRPEDCGPIACWRDGIEQASGEFIHINFDDDWADPSFVAQCLALMRSDVGFVYSRFAMHFPGLASTEVSPRNPEGVQPMTMIVRHLLRLDLTLSPGCALFRRYDVLKNLLAEVPGAAGPYGRKSGVGEDLLLFLLTSLDYPRYGHVREPLAHFLAHPHSITTNAIASQKYQQIVAAYANAKAHYRRQPGADPPRNRLQRRLDKLRWQLAR